MINAAYCLFFADCIYRYYTKYAIFWNLLFCSKRGQLSWQRNRSCLLRHKPRVV